MLLMYSSTRINMYDRIVTIFVYNTELWKLYRFLL